MRRAIGLLAACSFLFLGACGPPAPEMGQRGTYGGPCQEDGSCGAGLKCVYHVCKDDDSGE